MTGFIVVDEEGLEICPPAKEDEESSNDRPALLMGKLSQLVSGIPFTTQVLIDAIVTVIGNICRHWEDIALIGLVIFVPTIIARIIYRYRHQHEFSAEKFQTSSAHWRANIVSEFGKVLAWIYFVDICLLLMEQLKFDVDSRTGLWIVCIILFAWGARVISFVKRCYIIGRVSNHKDPVQVNAAKVANRFLDVIIYGATILTILDFLSIETGFAIKSIFGLSSFGTLAFSLASRDLMAEFLASLAIQANNMFRTGDFIWLGDGMMGTVQQMGWLNTMIRKGDEKVVRIPNTQIARAKMANVTRTTQSQVKQTLYISYDDWKKMPQLAKDVKEELKASCPKIISNGSRPFRAHWREIKKPYLEFVVDAHFTQRPACNAYWEMRQEALAAIFRACEKNDIKWAYKDFQHHGVVNFD